MATLESTSSARSMKAAATLPFPELPFVTTSGGLGINYFDVPHESYSDGCQTGVKAAWQYMRAVATDELNDGSYQDLLADILHGAVHAMGQTDALSQFGAAVGFMSSLGSILAAAATTAPWQAAIDAQLRAEERAMLDHHSDCVRANNAFRAAMGDRPRPAPSVNSDAHAQAKNRTAEKKAAAAARLATAVRPV